ncbi:ATP-dependent DNA helicase PIF1-like [Nylanderia fulva]|uniref:ATP-dependent DNA helicase PIF1-like n=1 Tax=Nylanderia fulva TaxID=613905 RepID=UPI0010FBBD3E|nr:ATP-dependent DNA helicase PIF1-like [Nylanderia fulva]
MSKELLESNLSTIFSILRNTEQYWRKPRSDLNCMTQHYGPATWFITLSPSEWLWEDLGEYIREVNGWHDTSLCVNVLVAKDPVSTSRFLDNKFRAMLDFINSKDHPIGEVTHYFWRQEYQGISLYGTDRNTTIKWLDVNQIRYRKLKSSKEIEALDAESTDIFYPSMIDNHYPHRPNKLENMSLYEFAQWYDISKIKPKNEDIEYYKMSNGYYLKRRQRRYLINHYRNDINTHPENYFFALLLMFKPWRKLEDLRNECNTYAESFHKIKLHLVEALQYHERLEELQKAFETAKQLVQQYLDDNLEKQQSQDDPENPIGVQNIKAGEAMQDFKELGDKEIREIDVSEMIEKLNMDQKRVFNKIINTIESDKSVLRLYVTGEGGTGKSFLIKTIKCWIKQNLNKDTAVAAPTGIAAFNVDGLTIHRLLQLPVEHGHTPKYKQLSDHVLKLLRANLKDVILFVIDEVSMISNLTLMYIHLRLSEIFDTSDYDDGWFGRKHILLFGDLLQLPPVHEEPIFMHLSNEKIAKHLGSLNAINLWTTLFNYEELTINMRQQGDNSYRELLSRIRIGLVTKSDCKILESRKISFKGESFKSRLNELCDFINNNLTSDTVCLLPTCNMCDILNNAMLSRIVSKEILLIAEDTINCVPYLKKKALKVLSNNDDDNSKTAGLLKQIKIKIGAKVMIRHNIDASLGLVNGTIAKVILIVQDTSTDYVEKIKLLLPSGSEYEIERVSVKFEVVDRVYVIRKQFPLSLSYGITIHKSQGLSLRSAIMDIGNSVFSCGQIYVALSRVTSLEGLHLINYDPSSVIASEKAIIEYNRLKQIHNQNAEMITMTKERYRKYDNV